MKLLSGKDLLAAILLHEDTILHIDDLTRLVVECKLSNLGQNADVPRQSVSPALTLNYDRFKGFHTGRYRIADTNLAEKNAKVKVACERYRLFRLEAGKAPSTDARISALLDALARKEQRCRELESKLKQISDILGN